MRRNLLLYYFVSYIELIMRVFCEWKKCTSFASTSFFLLQLASYIHQLSEHSYCTRIRVQLIFSLPDCQGRCCQFWTKSFKYVESLLSDKLPCGQHELQLLVHLLTEAWLLYKTGTNQWRSITKKCSYIPHDSSHISTYDEVVCNWAPYYSELMKRAGNWDGCDCYTHSWF